MISEIMLADHFGLGLLVIFIFSFSDLADALIQSEASRVKCLNVIKKLLLGVLKP